MFGLFKKNTNYFDKKIEPKCAYCEHGKPAKSEGKILCPRSGIVSEDFSCKKFSYSPFMRKPEKERPPVYQPPENSNDKAETNVKTDIPAAPEAVENQTQKPVHEAQFKPAEAAASVKPPESDTPESKKTESPKKETPPKSAVAVSDINLMPHDNSENIRRLGAVNKVPVAEIENHVLPKEIILPEVSENNVSSIKNTPAVRNSEEYLNNIPAQTVSGIENNSHTIHRIPAGTETAVLSELDSK